MKTAVERNWIKICGIRDVETAVRVAELGADAIGINFYHDSPRHVADIETATAIVAALPDSTQAVGVFVNHTSAQIRDICAATRIAIVQLHGDEPDSHIEELAGLCVIRALRVAADFRGEARAVLAGYEVLSAAPDAWLIDARVPDTYGGTGQTVDWSMFSPERRQGWPTLILAGGLSPENVAEAVSIVRPWGVDVASGVESSPGVKEMTLVERFITTCRSAMQEHR